MILVTGGAASGKSAQAEHLLCQGTQKRLYIATMQPFGKTAQERIKRHHNLRAGKGFDTVERYTDLAGLCFNKKYDGILVECMTNLLANEMFADTASIPNQTVVQCVVKGVLRLEKQCKKLVVVTGEIFSDGRQYTDETMLYLKNLAQVNQMLAHYATQVIQVVCGICIPLKGGETM